MCWVSEERENHNLLVSDLLAGMRDQATTMGREGFLKVCPKAKSKNLTPMYPSKIRKVFFCFLN